MPDMTPVGNTIQPPNTLNAFANVVNLKAGMANANQAQQQNQELTALHQFTQQAMSDPSYFNEDGSPNSQKFQTDAMKVAPVYGQAYIGQATQNFNEAINNRQGLLTLSMNQRKAAGDYFGSVADNPNAGITDWKDAIARARSLSDDKGYQGSIDAMLMHFPPIQNMNPAQQTATIRAFARQTAMAVGSPTLSAQPSTAFVQGPKGQQEVQTNPLYPGGVQPTGAPIKQGIAPTLATKPGTGGQYVIGPDGVARPVTEGQQPGQTPAPGQPGTQPTSGQPNLWQPRPGQLPFIQANTEALAQRAQAGINAANTSPQAIDALTRIGSLIDQGTWTGTAFSGFAQLKNFAASLGIDTSSAQNASELMKNIARFEASRAQAVGNTDASRSLFAAASPDYKYDPAAVKAVSQQALANEKIIQAYGKIYQSSQDPNVVGSLEQQFRSVPHLLEVYEFGQMRNQAEADAFLKRYGLTKDDIAKGSQQLKSMGLL